MARDLHPLCANPPQLTGHSILSIRMLDYERGPFHYLLVHPDPDPEHRDLSYRAGFSTAALARMPMLARVLSWPRNCVELDSEVDELVAARAAGLSELHLEPVGVGRLRERILHEPGRLWCVVSAPDTNDAVQAVLRGIPFPVLHVPARREAGGVWYGPVERRALARFAARAWLRAALAPGRRSVFRVVGALRAGARLVRRARPPRPVTLELAEYAADVLGPGALTLYAAGVRMREERSPAELGDADLPPLVLAYARAVRAQREHALAAHGLPDNTVVVELMLGAPAMMRERYRGGPRIRPELSRQAADAEALLRAMRDQTTYGLKPPPGFVERGPSDVARGILWQWSQEQEAFATVLAAVASARFAPALVLPPAVNHVRAPAEALGKEVRADAPRHAWAAEQAAKLGAGLREAVPEEMRGELDGARGHVKIVADAPLEWTVVEGFPLLLRAMCSRIPATPGDLLLELATRGSVDVPSGALAEILVVRALREDERLFPVLRGVLEELAPELRHLRLRHVDVASRDDLVRALNAFRGAMMIFEGHGAPTEIRKPHPLSRARGELDAGRVTIGGEKVELWTLPDDVRIPEIVVLSACDTHALDTHHPSVANAFLKAGAATVLGTALPVLGVRAAAFIRRLLVQLEMLRESLAEGTHGPVRWMGFAAAAQRMCWVEEMLGHLAAEDGVRLEGHVADEVRERAAGRILQHEPGWLDAVLDEVAARAGEEPAKVRRLASRRAYYTDSLAYLQLGNPENVGIFPDDHPRMRGWRLPE